MPIAEPDTPTSIDPAAGKEENTEESDVADKENPETFEKNIDSCPPTATDPRRLKEDKAIRKAMEAIIGIQISISYKKVQIAIVRITVWCVVHLSTPR